MRKAPALLLFVPLLASISFAMVGSQCPEVKTNCLQSACTDAGGNITDYGACFHSPGFDEEAYDSQLAHCGGLYDFCVENDGLIHNMSCCGPIFIFLPVLMLALRAGGS